MFQTKIVYKIKTHSRFSVTFFCKSYRLCDNVEKYCKAGEVTEDNIIRRMRIAWWISKDENTHSEYWILIAFPLLQQLHERASLLRYTYTACLAFNATCYGLDIDHEQAKNTVTKRQIINAMYKTSFYSKTNQIHNFSVYFGIVHSTCFGRSLLAGSHQTLHDIYLMLYVQS